MFFVFKLKKKIYTEEKKNTLTKSALIPWKQSISGYHWYEM